MVQIDGFPCCGAYPCYNKAHGHPVGYGKTWFDSYVGILRACREEAVKADRDFVMPTEGITEMFIPYLDCYMSRAHSMPHWHHDAFKAMPIPLFTYVYHEYLPPYGGEGSATWLRSEYSTYELRGLGLSLLWGRMFSVAIGRHKQPFEPSGIEPKMLDFFKRAYKASTTYAHDYVVRGRMLHPLPINTPEIEMKYWRWWTKPPSTHSLKSPAVLSAAWQSPKGSKAAFFVNIASEARTIEVTLPRANLSVTLCRDGVREKRTFAAKSVTLRMKPLEILMLEYE